MTPGERWAALKADLIKRIDEDAAVLEGYREAGLLARTPTLGGLLSANRSTLSRMRELEAGW